MNGAETDRALPGRDLTVRVPKTAEIIASALRGQIVRGELPEGSMLPPESVLIEQFGVSRPSVREALRVLESEGLVTIQRGARGGGRVKQPDVDFAARYLGRIMQFEGVTVADVWQARTIIEPIAVRLLAAQDGRAATVKALEVTLNLAAELSEDLKTYTILSNKFHEQLVEACGNQTLGIMWGCLKDALRDVTMNMIVSEPSNRRPRAAAKTAEARRKLLTLIAAGDGAGAEEFWSREMKLIHKRLLDRNTGRATLVEVIE